MIIFPAIDLYGGKAVRLYKGDYNNMTVYSENPIEINQQIAEGFTDSQTYEVILDRKEAIQKAILESSGTHSVVIAGKGHETTQEIGSNVTYFSDIEVVKHLLSTEAKNENSL